MLHYGTVHDCLVVAGKIYRNCFIQVNQDIFQSLQEINQLPPTDLMPWKMIEVLVSCAPALLEQNALMEYDKTTTEGECAYIYIESLSLDIPSITIHNQKD
ncbi:MAG: hypothetical protein NVS4B7_09030 [Ktedonobacteraceae bacterium]